MQRLDPRFSSITVDPKSDEVDDKNFPKNCHNAMQLFLMCGMSEQAQNCGQKVTKYIET
jgi:hypothetical protein